MPVCTSCGEENPAKFRLCGYCGTPLPTATIAAPAEEERKLISVVFTDIVGSTARAERLDPEDVRAMLVPYHARVRTELERHGGTVEKFIGDAAVAIFGAPQAHEDDPERAVRAALAIKDAIAELNATDDWLDLHIRTGVNTGEALVMLDAKASEGEFMAAGDVMNTAARIQSAAPVDGILVSDDTYRAARHAIEFREHEPISAKGKTAPVPVWEVAGAKEETARRATSRCRLVGRDQELEALLEAWRRTVREGKPGMATLVGPPGIGKTRLMEEFAKRVDGAALHWGRCLSYGEGITYWPIVEIIRDAAGIVHDDSTEAISLKLGDLLFELPTDVMDELRTMASALANLVGVPRTPEQTYSATETTQAELHWGIRRMFELRAVAHPVVLVLEDLHWAEPTLLELVDYIVAGVTAPVFVLASARPELAEDEPALLRAGPGRSIVELDALDEDESASLLAELVGGHVPQGGAALLRNAGGNPLFLEETIRMLTDEGLLGPDVEEGAASLETVRIPTSLQGLIGSRLDSLPPPEKRTAQHASVLGTVFWPGAIVYAADGGGDGAQLQLAQPLEGLERRDLVFLRDTSSVAGEDEWAFKHILIRDVAYARLPKKRRITLHSRVADWTAELPGGDDLVEIVAYHLEQACRLSGEVARTPDPPPILAAIDALIRAAERAEAREGIREADRFYARALEIVGTEHPEQLVELRLRRCRMQVALGEFAAPYETLPGVVEDAERLGRPEVACAALLLLTNMDFKEGHAAGAKEHLAAARTHAERLGDRRLLIRASYESAQIRMWFDGTIEAAVEDMREALALAEEIDDRALRIEGHMRLGSALFNMGRLAEADSELVRCIELASELGSHRDEARATSILGFIRSYHGEVAEAEELALKALTWLERTGDANLEPQNLRALAKYALARGDLELAEERLRQALPVVDEGGGWLAIEIYRYLIEAVARQGRLEEARELAAAARERLPEEDAIASAALLTAEAELAAAENRIDVATASFRNALELLEQQQLETDLAETRVAFGRALRRLGEADEARDELERARETFTAMGAATLVSEIDRELDLARGARGAGVAADPPPSATGSG